jgi:hypothetical protein
MGNVLLVKAVIQEAIRTQLYARASILGQNDYCDYINRENNSIKFTFRNSILNLAVF